MAFAVWRRKKRAAAAGPGSAVQSGRCAAGPIRSVPESGGTSGAQATRPSPSATTRPPAAAASRSAHTGHRGASLEGPLAREQPRWLQRQPDELGVGVLQGGAGGGALVEEEERPQAARIGLHRGDPVGPDAARQARLLVGEVAEADEVARRVDDHLVDALLGGDAPGTCWGSRAPASRGRPAARRPGRSAWVSGGVSASLPGQKGQPAPVAGRPTSWGRAARAGASRTGSSVSGSRRTEVRRPSGGAATSRSSSPGSWPWTAWTWACRPPRRRPPPCAGGSARSRAGRRPRARRRPRRPRGWP